MDSASGFTNVKIFFVTCLFAFSVISIGKPAAWILSNPVGLVKVYSNGFSEFVFNSSTLIITSSILFSLLIVESWYFAEILNVSAWISFQLSSIFSWKSSSFVIKGVASVCPSITGRFVSVWLEVG